MCLRRPHRISTAVSAATKRRCQDMYLHIQQIQDPRVIQSKDALENDDMRRIYRRAAINTGMLLERVDRDLGTLPTDA